MPITITVRDNGPYLISGDDVPTTQVLDPAGNPLVSAKGAGKTIALCRCGASETKPFCDGAHNRAGFKSECPARDLQPPAPKP